MDTMDTNTQNTQKRKSQFPVAIAYFTTLIVCLGIFGLLGKYIMKNFVNFNSDKVKVTQGLDIPTKKDRITILYVQVDDFNEMNHAMLVKILPDIDQIKIVPVSNKLLANEHEEDIMEELENIYISKGVVGVKNAVENTMGINVDKYMTVTNASFDNVVDYIGGVTVAPKEDIFHTDENTGEQISCKKGTSMSLNNIYTRLYINYPKFSEGPKQNVAVMGDVMTRFINEMFTQADNFTNNMDTFFNVIYNNSDTDMTKSEYLKIKKGILYMVANADMPCEALIPTGNWDNNILLLDTDFSKRLKEFFEE